MDKFLLLHFDYSFVSQVSISAFLSFWHRIFRTLLILDKYRYRTWHWTIAKSYVLTLQHLIMQLEKMLIKPFHLKTTRRHCRKRPIAIEQECSRQQYACWWTDNFPVKNSIHIQNKFIDTRNNIFHVQIQYMIEYIFLNKHIQQHITDLYGIFYNMRTVWAAMRVGEAWLA